MPKLKSRALSFVTIRGEATPRARQEESYVEWELRKICQEKEKAHEKVGGVVKISNSIGRMVYMVKRDNEHAMQYPESNFEE